MLDEVDEYGRRRALMRAVLSRAGIKPTQSSTLTAPSQLSPPRNRETQVATRSRDIAISPIAQRVEHTTMLDEVDEHSRRRALMRAVLSRAGTKPTQSSNPFGKKKFLKGSKVIGQ